MHNKVVSITAKDGQRTESLDNVKIGERTLWLENRLKHLYDKNPHVRLLQMRLTEIEEGVCVLVMPVVREVHGNLYGAVHGGALASLADTAMGLACASTGKQVVTLDLNINYIASADEGETVKAVARVIHGGKSTMVVECEMIDTTGRLLAKARGTFFVIGQFEYTED